MPVLTKKQAFEAVMELENDQREQLLEELEEQRTISLELGEEHKTIIRDEVAAHRRDPSTSISRDELMVRMQATL